MAQDNKCIKVNTKLWKKLQQLKLDKDFRSIDLTIEFLYDIYLPRK